MRSSRPARRSPKVKGKAKIIQPVNVITLVDEIAAMAIAFGPVPIGVAMPPKFAPIAIPINRARRKRLLLETSAKSGESAAIIIAAAAIFDIHIESTAVAAIVRTKRRSFDPRDRRTAKRAMRRSIP